MLPFLSSVHFLIFKLFQYVFDAVLPEKEKKDTNIYIYTYL